MLMMELLGDVHFYSAIDGEKYTVKEKRFLIPVYGDIPCGPPNFVDDEIKGYLEIPEDMIGVGEYFVLRAKGDSMTDAGIVAGDLVVVKKQNYAEESQIVVAFIDGETTLKRIYKDNNTKADLNWMNKKSRSSVEMNNKSIRPAIITGDVDVSGYDTIYLGFPIWWYVAPTLINTFLEAYDFTGKKIVLFATSGSSGFGNTVTELQPSAPGAKIIEAKVLSGIITETKISALIDACK